MRFARYVELSVLYMQTLRCIYVYHGYYFMADVTRHVAIIDTNAAKLCSLPSCRLVGVAELNLSLYAIMRHTRLCYVYTVHCYRTISSRLPICE
ncbi:hypothetical protein GDO81_007233 [Engystomops pustulosus]|uniref:Secreted protein n=1 Tax=Engystomops pustulosus TaxID=76066 RepID=A0AAV7C5S7_ENGPU|nr:hypothetical protein GDO81_007233 [Engystomops pustulosus]